MPASDDEVCKFCGSGMGAERVCSVCNRSADEPPDPKSTEIRTTFAQATAIVQRLVDDGRLELASASGFARTVDLTAEAMEEKGGEEAEPSVIAEALLETWENASEVAEVFIDDFDLAAVVYSVRSET